MKGKHHVILETRHIKYEFDIKRNITIVQGDSATGKTTLIGLLAEYGSRGEASGIMLQSDVPCFVYSAPSDIWQLTLGAVSGSIVFIDEGYSFIYSKDFAGLLAGDDNYYVLITRKPVRNLPYSVKEIYGIRTTGRYHFPEQAYHEFYPLFEEEADCPLEDKDIVVMVEEEKSGYQFFSNALEKECIDAGGNTNFFRKIRERPETEGVIVIADGAAFGAYIDELLELREYRGSMAMYFPESFEWMILKSGIISAGNIEDVLQHPEDFIDSREFLSWERFFTDYLKDATKGDRLKEYHKSRLAEYYLGEAARAKILNVLPDDLLKYILS